MIDFIKATLVNGEPIFINEYEILTCTYGFTEQQEPCCIIQLRGEEGQLFVKRKLLDNWLKAKPIKEVNKK